MASTSSIGGLISGLDTKTLISQLVQVAAAPQARLKSTLSTTNARITAAQAINSKAASMATAAAALTSPSTYTTAKATSSSTAVTATVTGNPSSGSLSFTVTQLTAAHSLATGALSTSSSSPATFTITAAGQSPTTITATTGSPADLVTAINAAGAGVTAQAITDSSGNQRLVLTASATGDASTFTVSGLSADADGDGIDDDAVLTQGQNAKAVLGDPTSASAITISSSTNTFKNLVSGVDVTVTSTTTTPVTVTTATDTGAISSKVTNLVASMNAVLGDIAFHTTAPPLGKTASATQGGLLSGDSTMRGVANQVLDAVSGSVGADSAALAGLQVTRDGRVSFDQSRFDALYKSDPVRAQSVLTAFGTAVQGVGKAASDSSTGSVTAFITGSKDTAKTLADRISDWDTRLTAKQATLTAQYTALETNLSRLKSQSDSLAQALAGLTSSN